MKLLAYSLRDMKADSFQAPFFVPNETAARRLIPVLAQNPNSDVGRYPADFMMYRIGSLDTDTGFLSSESPSEICTVLSCFPKPDPRQTLIPGTEPVLTEAN